MVFHRVKNMGKGKNAGYQHFSPFTTMSSKGYFLGGVKSCHCVIRYIRSVMSKFYRKSQ